ncbi:hypothetical protein Gbro_2534 [Gordonia bronchialis DSM 43247]|uniref:Uncharacterized protein n=1 Tax=Gordonia bronchialis (strain ATCC 25592 / DSM 43247 / BCRC 13721 / JCM 3198 / KCTC 3076 / NBRC 16047 / NCTC 10667) TaxID=526226 RepID=D0LEQ1_GORB4|nr:hypothetical protein [Gordonia bronchialis]ACY21775.1 hypothetical protein Gbro_2534 [Gordonia bronchialis DSM 43247]MCC3324561.1 hypothetical protein [Gordonia bronchialis]QGS24619.1 hypothetical protein FOB84_11115 [Gordonia bronchialis]UAK40829.1 hypothetical protein K8O93_05255 [Gordonia bronchialis]STQ64663.1 Uncharacterised protein [Gordonia bronchialis]
MAADNDPKTSHHSDDDSDDVAHPGPADHGGTGGMATREVTPELAEGDDSDN